MRDGPALDILEDRMDRDAHADVGTVEHGKEHLDAR